MVAPSETAGALSGTILCLQVLAATMLGLHPETASNLRVIFGTLRGEDNGNEAAYGPGYNLPLDAMIQLLDDIAAGKSPPSFTLIPGGKDDDD